MCCKVLFPPTKTKSLPAHDNSPNFKSKRAAFCSVELSSLADTWFLSSPHPPLTWHRVVASEGMGTHEKENITALPRASCAPSPVSLPVCSVAFQTSQAAAKVPASCMSSAASEDMLLPYFYFYYFYPMITSFKRALKDVF